MKDKIEEFILQILRKYGTRDSNGIWHFKQTTWKNKTDKFRDEYIEALVKELTTLINQEKKEAVERFVEYYLHSAIGRVGLYKALEEYLETHKSDSTTSAKEQVVKNENIRPMNELQKRFEEKFFPKKVVINESGNGAYGESSFTLGELYDFFHAEITDMLDRLRLEKQEYEPDYPIPNTDTVEGYNSAVDDLNNKIEREKK